LNCLSSLINYYFYQHTTNKDQALLEIESQMIFAEIFEQLYV
jgi:hypothetical protein